MRLNAAWKYRFGVLAAALFACEIAQSAPLILDNFSEFQSVAQRFTGSVATSTAETESVEGGWRTLQVQKTAPGSIYQSSSLIVDPFLGALTFEQSVLVRSRGQVTYSGSAAGIPSAIPQAPSIKNISPFNVWEPGYGLQIYGSSDNLGIPVTFTFYGAGTSTSATLQLRSDGQGDTAYLNPFYVRDAGAGNSFFFIPLISFSNATNNAAVFSAVSAFRILFDGTSTASSVAGTDARLSYYAIGPVPEPDTYALIGLGMFTLGTLRRRTRA